MSDNVNVQERTPSPPVAIGDLGADLLDEMREGDSGHAAVTLTPHAGEGLKQTVVALGPGHTLSPDAWNGEATLYVISGSASVSDVSASVPAGGWLPLSRDADVRADEELVALLTVVPATD